MLREVLKIRRPLLLVSGEVPRFLLGIFKPQQSHNLFSFVKTFSNQKDLKKG